MKALATEFIGTFFLVFTIGMTVLQGVPLAPLAIGCMLMVMVYMGGHISGAHYNPAVTIAVTLAGKAPAKNAGPYIVVQVLGALAAAFAVRYFLGEAFKPSPPANLDVARALLAEIICTFALALVVLNVACSAKTKGNSYYGAAIGFTVVAAALSVSNISGRAFNPAVGAGLLILKLMTGGSVDANLWLYIVGPIGGAALAAGVFRMQEGA